MILLTKSLKKLRNNNSQEIKLSDWQLNASIDTASVFIQSFANAVLSQGIAPAIKKSCSNTNCNHRISNISRWARPCPNIPTKYCIRSIPTLSTNSRNVLMASEAVASQTVNRRVSDDININVNVGVDEVTNTQNRVARIIRAAELPPSTN